MKYICTLSDFKYLPRGLALIDSLNKHNKDVYVFYLCMDQKTYDALTQKNIPNVEPIPVSEILQAYPDAFSNVIPSSVSLQVEKDTGESAVSNEFHYRMSSHFPDFILRNRKVDHVIYSDADIYFYQPLDSIYNDVGDKSFGVVEHRIEWTGCGVYNVGIIYMKNDSHTLDILTLWKYCVSTPKNEYEEVYGVCSDQKYLELVELKFKDHFAIIGDTTGHLAPWNLRYHMFTPDGKLVWKDVVQELVYFHFSNFIPNLTSMTYQLGPRHGVMDTRIPWLQEKCFEYLKSIKDNT